VGPLTDREQAGEEPRPIQPTRSGTPVHARLSSRKSSLGDPATTGSSTTKPGGQTSPCGSPPVWPRLARSRSRPWARRTTHHFQRATPLASVRRPYDRRCADWWVRTFYRPAWSTGRTSDMCPVQCRYRRSPKANPIVTTRTGSALRSEPDLHRFARGEDRCGSSALTRSPHGRRGLPRAGRPRRLSEGRARRGRDPGRWLQAT
jgi:hypothetical protein